MKHFNSPQKLTTLGLLLVAWMFSLNVARAQSIANYTFSTNVTGSLALDMNANTVDMSTGTTQLVAADLDDNASSLTGIGFTFYFMGNSFTQFSANSNGNIALGSSTIGTAAYSSSGATASSPRICPFTGDLRTGLGGKVHYKLIGTAPNRTLVVEFLNMSVDYVGTPGSNDGTFQARLYESSGVIEYVYGSMFRNSSTTDSPSETFNIGISSGTTATTRMNVDTNNVTSFGTLAVNVYPASANVAKLHSTTNGSRRAYVFTPAPGGSLAPATSLTFSPVGGSNMTLNWVASSPVTGVIAYAIYSSTDGINYSFVSNVPVGTNTYAATGLLPSTTYYWKVVAMSEGSQGASLDGSQATIAATAYTWNVASGQWGTAGNWSPTRTTPDATDILQFTNAGLGTTQTATDIPTQTIGRLIVDNGITANLQATATATLTIASDNTVANELSVTAGSALMSNGTAAALTIRYSGTGSTGNIAGTVEATSASGSTTANTFNFSNGTSSVTTVTGTLALGQSGGTGVPVMTGSAASLIMTGTAVYNHKFTTSAGAVPTATWQAGSAVNITGYTSNTTGTSGFTQTFSNVTWNCTSQTGNLSLGGSVPTVTGTFTVASTGSGQLRSAAGTSPTFTVANFVQTGGTFELNTGAGSTVFNVSASFTHSGGSFCSSGNSAGTPTINFNGTTGAQNVSFFNAAPTGPLAYRISNGMGINLLGTGTLTTTFNINNNSGVRVSTKAATPINTTLTLNYNVTGTTLTYDTTASYTMTAVEFPATNGPANLTINVGANNVITMPVAFGSRALAPTGANGVLTMTSGDLDVNSNTFTLGTSAANPGTLTYTAGAIRLTSGSFTRFFGTTGLPTTATAAGGSFPIASGFKSRAVGLYFSTATALSTGGSVTVSHSGAGGLTATSVTDGAYTVDTRTNASWTFTHSGIVATGTISVRLTGGSLFGTDAVANIRMVQSATAAGTYSAGTGSSPNFQANRTGLTVADLAQTHYMGAATADIYQVFVSAASGDWNNPATWDNGATPVCSGNVFIGPGHNVTVNSATNQSKNVTVQTGGTLSVASGDLTIGCTLNNTTLTLNGTLNVSGGTLNLNGNINMPVGGVFTQSGGDINVDGNAAGVAANSVGSGVTIVLLKPASANSVNLTGGTLTIVDPHANSTASDVLDLDGAFNGPVNVTAGHTLRFGDGVSTDAGGNATNGFRINTWLTTTGMPLGNVVVEGPVGGTNRHVTTRWNQPVLGNITVNNGGELRMDILLLNGNIQVNTGGTFTSLSSLTLTNSVFLDASTITVLQGANAQTITNNGTMRNLVASPTASLTALTINNTNATGVTFNSPVSVSGTLTLAKGKINTTTANTFQLGTATAAGTLAGGSDSAFFTGPFARTFAASRTASGTYTVATLYPVGKGSTYLPLWVDPTTNAGGAVTISGEGFNSNSGTMGLAVTSLSTNRWETLITAGGANFVSSNLQIADGASMLASNKILQAPTAAGAYTGIFPTVTFAAGTPNTIRTTGGQILAANFSGYFAYGDLIPCVAPADQPTSFASSLLAASSFTGSFTAAVSNPSHYLVVRYATGASATNPVDYTNYTAGAALGAGTVAAITTTPTFNETGLTAGTAYDYYIYSFSNSACFGPVYNTISPLTATVTTCAAATVTPTTASAVNVSSGGFTARWTHSTSPSPTYELDLSTSASFTTFVPGFQAFNVGVDSFYVFTGLNPATTYYYRVRAVSGVCYSTLSGSTSVATLCLSSAVPVANESFDAASIPVCWNAAILTGATNWAPDDANDGVPAARTGARFMGKNWNNSDAIIASMPIDMTTSATGSRINVWIHRGDDNDPTDRIRFHVNTTPDLTGATQVLEIFPKISVAPSVALAGWYNYTAIIPASYNGSTALYVIAQGTTSAGFDAYGIGFDDFTVEPLPACADPSPVTISNVTNVAATLEWTAPPVVPTNGYDYYINTSNAAPTGGTTPTATGLTGTSVVIPALAPTTTYYVWMRSDCGGGSLSTWSISPVSFTTQCNPVTSLPYTEGLNDIGVIPTCWNSTLLSGFEPWDITEDYGTDITGPASGDGFASKSWDNSDALLFTNPFDLTVLPASTSAAVNVYLHRHASANTNDRYQVYVNTTPDLAGAAKLLDIYSRTSIAPTVAATGWYPYQFEIPDSFNTYSMVYVIFRGTTSAGFSSYALGVDSFRIKQMTAPVMLTGTAGTLTQNSATISANTILDDGFALITTSGMVVSTNPAPAIGGPGVIDSVTTPNVATGSYSFNLAGLTNATTYYYRAYAINSEGTSYGADSTFTTLAAPLAPSVTGSAASAITISTASLGGNITSDGGDPVVISGVVLSTATGPVIGGPGVTDITTSPLVTLGSFSVSASALTPATKYYYKAYAINGVGTTYSVEDSFTTEVLIASLPYNQDFEGTGTGWTVTTEPTYINNWVLGTPSKVFLDDAHSGTNAWVTNLSADYDDDVLSSVVSPQFNFTSVATDPILRFYHKFIVEESWDAMVVEISINGGAWTRLDMTIGNGANNFNTANSYAWYNLGGIDGPIDNAKFSTEDGSDIIYSSQNNGWVQSATRLTGAAGQGNVKFRFTFGSDVSNGDEGWALDDIEVVEITTPSVAASAVSTSNITNTTTDVSWTNGNGDGRLVVARLTSTAPVAPTDNIMYSADNVFTTADSTGLGNHIVFIGTVSPVTVSGLDLVTDYTYDVYEYNGKYMHVKFSTASSNNATTLPVKLTTFTAKAISNDVLVSWTTSSEINNKGFEVERSADGITFEKAGFVKGAGNSNRLVNYSLTDAKAFIAANSNVLYYRLKQVDMDGKFSYSNVVRVNKNAEKANSLSVYPNPFENKYSVSFNAAGAGTVNLKMTDIQGKVVAEQTSIMNKGMNDISFDNLNALQAGVYFVKVTVEGETQVLKLVKH